MQAVHQLKEPYENQLYLDSTIRNLKLQSTIVQIDLILNGLQIRERYLHSHLVYAVKNNIHLGMIYAKELLVVRKLATKIHHIQQQMKNLHISTVATKKTCLEAK